MGVINTKKLLEILDVARYAPSVHNTQPWRIKSLSNDRVEISLDTRYVLAEGDPIGRQTTICLGIFTEAVRLAAADIGLSADNVEFKGQQSILRFVKSTRGINRHKTNSQLLRQRCTDRSIYKSSPLKPQAIEFIQQIPNVQDTTVWVVTDRSIITQVAILIRRATSVALSKPAFRRELANYLLLPWSSKRRGISVTSLYLPRLLELSEPLLLRAGIGTGIESYLELLRWQSASALVFITARGDMPPFWFAAGRTYLQACLAIEKIGFSQATSAALVEASNYHEDIEGILKTRQRLLAMIRLGKGSQNKHRSPRVDADELLH